MEWTMTRITFAVLLGCALLVAAPNAFATEAKVTIDNFTFSPAEIDVTAGSRVTWTNNDDIPHTVTDADNPRTAKSPPLDTGESYSRVFDRPGTYKYFCSLHPHMQGTVVVR
jgi:plastocyanin